VAGRPILSARPVAALLASAALASALAHAPGAALAGEVSVIEHAQAVASDAPQPPPEDAPWQPVSLPDHWRLSRPGFDGRLWYRARFDVPEGPIRTHALYAPRLSAGQLRFFVNGRPLAWSQAYGDPRPTDLHRPLVFTVPPAMLRPGGNVIHVQVIGRADRHAGLTRLAIGPGIAVRQQYYEPRYDWQVTSVAVFAGALLVSGLVALFFWRGEGRDPVPFWFGVTALSWTLSAWLLLWPPATSSEALRDVLAFAARHLYATPLLVLCLRVGGRRMRAVEAGLWSLFAIGCAASAVDGIAYQAGIGGAASLVYLALIVGFLAWLVQLRRRDADCPCVLLSLALVTLVLFSGYDWARWMGYADFDGLLLAPFATPFLILALGANVVRRHAEARRAIERANRELEQRVAEKAHEIERTWRRVEQAQREQAVLRERQRIMADMHDGLGSGLVSLASIVQARSADLGEIERRLDDLLTELRATVDSLEPVEGDLGVVLGNIRYRMRSAIEASGARFQWKVEPLPLLDDLTPDRVLAIQRIVLEALANALHHSRAGEVALSAHADDARSEIVIRVTDDGGGFDPTDTGRGRGLRSMRERASKLGATLDIRSAPTDGTEVKLRLSYRKAEPAQSIADAH